MRGLEFHLAAQLLTSRFVNPDADPISALREALEFSPENVPLRKHLADTLVKYGRFAEAEAEYKKAIHFAKDESSLQVALANAYFQQEKHSEAFVILESLEKGQQLDGNGLLLYARLLSQTTELVKAAAVYKQAKAALPGLADEALETELAPFLVEYDSQDPDDPRKVPAGELAQAVNPDIERPRIRFDSVGGMDAVKEQIRMKIIHPLANAELFKAYGKSVGGGILLYGPPGCGKTHLARATAGEVKAAFLSIGLHDVLDMWIGQSERNLHEIFQNARLNQPSVLFFDEVDALAAARSDMRKSASRQTINQFLAELDGAEESNDGVLILAATNAPWHLDAAFRRPGRFDRIIFVPPPDEPARAAILRVMLREKPADAIDADAVARKTDGFSGADLKALVDSAIEAKLEEAMRKGDLVPLTTKDLLKAAKSIKPSTREWFNTAKNHALYANQSGLYDDILDYLKIKKP